MISVARKFSTVWRYSILLFLLVCFSGCQAHKMDTFENPEFPDKLLPSDLADNLLDKYMVGDVIVKPQIHPTDSTQKEYGVFIKFFSELSENKIKIKDVKLTINNKKIPYGENILKKKYSKWESYPANSPYLVSHIKGDAIRINKDDLVKSNIAVTLNLDVTNSQGERFSKSIDVRYLHKEVTYLE